MYALVEIGGLQFRVEEGEKIKVPKLEAAPQDTVEIDKVMLLSGEKGIMVGRPYVSGAKVKATVAEVGKGEKIIIFKFKRRTKYRRKRGHRQDFTQLAIDKIVWP
ncbi:MAG: 50S ribosomal protein L21 [Limisphaerales bacterium]